MYANLYFTAVTVSSFVIQNESWVFCILTESLFAFFNNKTTEYMDLTWGSCSLCKWCENTCCAAWWCFGVVLTECNWPRWKFDVLNRHGNQQELDCWCRKKRERHMKRTIEFYYVKNSFTVCGWPQTFCWVFSFQK